MDNEELEWDQDDLLYNYGGNNLVSKRRSIFETNNHCSTSIIPNIDVNSANRIKILEDKLKEQEIKLQNESKKMKTQSIHVTDSNLRTLLYEDITSLKMKYKVYSIYQEEINGWISKVNYLNCL